MFEVHYVFGCKAAQDLAEYPSGPTDPFVFTVAIEDKPSTWQNAFALLGFYQEDFMKACLAAQTSSQLSPIDDSDVWIPTCYLYIPTIEVSDGEECEELLLDNERPNPWLSRKAS